MSDTFIFTSELIPRRSTVRSAGYDLCLQEDIYLEPNGEAQPLIPVTFTHPAGTASVVLPRSSTMKKLHLEVSGYACHDGIHLFLYDTPFAGIPVEKRCIPKGTAVAQLLVISSGETPFSADVYHVQEKDRRLVRAVYAPCERFPLLTVSETFIDSCCLSIVPTQLAFDICEDEVLFVKTTKTFESLTGLRQSNDVGVIDSDYFGNQDNLGHVGIPLYNPCASSATVPEGIQIAEGFLRKFLIAENEFPPETERTGGFGSTDKE